MVAVWKGELRILRVILAWSVIEFYLEQSQGDWLFAWCIFAYFDSNGRKCQDFRILKGNENKIMVTWKNNNLYLFISRVHALITDTSCIKTPSSLSWIIQSLSLSVPSFSPYSTQPHPVKCDHFLFLKISVASRPIRWKA